MFWSHGRGHSHNHKKAGAAATDHDTRTFSNLFLFSLQLAISSFLVQGRGSKKRKRKENSFRCLVAVSLENIPLLSFFFFFCPGLEESTLGLPSPDTGLSLSDRKMSSVRQNGRRRSNSNNSKGSFGAGKMTGPGL